MPSAFQKACKLVTKEIGDKELLPVTCLMDATKIHHFTILKSKKKIFPRFRPQPDVPIQISIMDILEKSSSEPETTVNGPFQVTDTVCNKRRFGAGVSVDAAQVDVNASWKSKDILSSSLKFQIITTPLKSLIKLLTRKLQDQELSSLEQCRDSGVDLYVVTDTVELCDSSELITGSWESISGDMSIFCNPMVKGNVQGKYGLMRKKKISVQKGMVVAYKKKKLIFRDKGWDLLLFEDDKNKKTFEDEIGLPRVVFESGEDSIPPIGRIAEPPGQDFKSLQEEVIRKVEDVDGLSRSFRDTMLNNIQAMLGDHEALQELGNMLEEEPLGYLDGPGGAILNELRKDSEDSWVNPKHFLSYLLEAILELSDIQHALLAQSIEKRILPHQRELVRSILEPNFKYPWCIPFTIKPQLLAPLQGEGVAITYGLLQECGLKMELNNPRSTWDLEAKEPLFALFVSMSVLQGLIEA